MLHVALLRVCVCVCVCVCECVVGACLAQSISLFCRVFLCVTNYVLKDMIDGTHVFLVHIYKEVYQQVLFSLTYLSFSPSFSLFLLKVDCDAPHWMFCLSLCFSLCRSKQSVMCWFIGVHARHCICFLITYINSLLFAVCSVWTGIKNGNRWEGFLVKPVWTAMRISCSEQSDT